MPFNKEDFIRSITKVAQETSVGDNEDQATPGQQSDDVPELLQPDKGLGHGSRGEAETFSTGVEAAHTKNREGSYLPNAFDNFNDAARAEGKDLKSALSNYGPGAVSSTAMANAGQSKMGSAQLSSFTDELTKIMGS